MMAPLPTLIVFALLLALPITLVLSALVGWRYQASVRRLMRLAPLPSDASETTDEAVTALPVHEALSLPSRVGLRRLPLALAGLSLLIGLTAAVLYLVVHFGDLSPLRLLITALVMATPGLVLQAQILRWPFRKQASILLGWSLLLLLLVKLASRAFGLDQMGWIAPQVLLPLIVLGILFGIPGLRTIAPYLFPPIWLLVFLASLGQQLLGSLVSSGRVGVLGVLLSIAGARGTLVLFTAVPVVLVLLPAHSLTSVLGRLYRAKAFSDLSYLYGTSWFLILMLQLIPGWTVQSSNGGPMDGRPLIPLLAWLWIPLFFGLHSPLALFPNRVDPPALLVLRVFRSSNAVAWLFDNVVQRWRGIGPVLLISAGDLASRTIEPNELVAFLEGRLRERYILDADDLHRQLAGIDAKADHDGRYRVTDFCCYASSWKRTLDALLTRSSSVLMDLRGFSTENQGCLYELTRISQASHLAGVVVLADASTDREAAEHALRSHPSPPRVHWLEAPKQRLRGVDQLIDRLLAAGC
jgi:hypothetical protein